MTNQGLLFPPNTMTHASQSERAIQDMTDWHDEEGHMFALDMCDHPACKAFSRVTLFTPQRTGWAGYIKQAILNYIGQANTNERARRTAETAAKPSRKKRK